MITNLGHWLRTNKGSSRLGLPVARIEKLDNLIHGLKPVAGVWLIFVDKIQH
jgi:hypothetical protein